VSMIGSTSNEVFSIKIIVLATRAGSAWARSLTRLKTESRIVSRIGFQWADSLATESKPKQCGKTPVW
jgi:hypothetical protein